MSDITVRHNIGRNDDCTEVMYIEASSIPELHDLVNKWFEEFEVDYSLISSQLVLDHFKGRENGKGIGYIQVITYILRPG